MNRTKKMLLATAVAGLVILPTSAFAAGGHQGHHANLLTYRGHVVTATQTSPLEIAVKKAGDLSFVITPKTRFRMDHQRLTTEPAFVAGERVMVRAKKAKNGSLIARVVKIAPQKSA